MGNVQTRRSTTDDHSSLSSKRFGGSILVTVHDRDLTHILAFEIWIYGITVVSGRYNIGKPS
jgi:hypothetical protein